MNGKTCIILAALALSGAATAQITVPGANGTDGPLNVTSSTVIDLSQAPTGTWDQDNTANASKGVYDPARWAVVYKYSSVNIATGATVTFRNNATNAPVIWLVNGDVTINGTVSVSSPNAPTDGTPGVPGPGGFRGGTRPSSSVASGGFGPGGASQATSVGSNGSYATVGTGTGAGKTYGNASVLPLIGGSGGSTQPPYGGTGGGGGGAILIAATGTITVNGSILANAGNANGGHGSGGAIRLVSNSLAGIGSLSAVGNNGSGDGRIRLEAQSISPTVAATPTPSAARPASPAQVWAAATDPIATIVSVAQQNVSADPKANFGPSADVPVDMVIGASPFDVVIETKNVPTTATVNLRVVPLNGADSLVKATLTSGDVNDAFWTANINPPSGTTSLQVRVEAQ